MYVDFLNYAGKVLLMVTKRNWKNEKLFLLFQPFGYIFICCSIADSLGQGNLPVGPQAEVLATRKDVMSCNWEEAVSQEAEGVCCGVLGLILKLCLGLSR